MANNISTAIATTYLHHNLPVPRLPPFRRVYRIAIRNDFPHAALSCGTIAILAILHLTLGQIQPGNINTNNTNRRHTLTFHQALLQWLILGTPPNLWNLKCINKGIVRCEPIHFSVTHSHCGFMQSLTLPIGTSTIPRHYHTHTTPPLPDHASPNPAPKSATPPALRVTSRGKNQITYYPAP